MIIGLFFFLLFVLIFPPSSLGLMALRGGAFIQTPGLGGDSGRECVKGMLDATKWLNQHEGIFGMKLEVILIEDTSQPAEIMAAYRKLNEADRILLLYIYSIDTALDLIPHIHFDRLPTFISSFPSQFTNATIYPYAFSINPTPLDQAKIAIHFIAESFKLKMKKPKLAFVGSPDYFGQHFLEEAKSYAKSLGIGTGPNFWIPDTSQFPERPGKNTLLLSALQSFKPDFIYMSLTSKEASSLLEDAQKMNLKTKWIGSMRAFDENLNRFEEVLGIQPISPFEEDVPGKEEVKEAHQRWHPYDSHSLSYVEGWATVKVISEALGRSLPEQGFSRERVRLALEGFKNLKTGGLTPPLTFSYKDHRPYVESRIFMIKNGTPVKHTGFISIGR